MMPSRIRCIGTALPANSISQRETFRQAKQYSCENLRQEHALEKLYTRTTIKNRSSVLDTLDLLNAENLHTTGARMRRYNDDAPELALAACVDALSKVDINARQITHLITVSCTGFSAPGFDIALVEKLSLPATVFRTHVGYMGCHGAFNALRVAEAFIEANPSSVVLLCAVEICTLHFQQGWIPDSLVANSLFGDGAGAAILTGGDEGLNYFSSRSSVVPATTKAMTWQIGDYGFVMTLSAEVPAIISDCLKDFVEPWLAHESLKISDIGGWAVHPGGPKILDAVENSLGLQGSSLTHSRQILSEHGNMSSPTVLFILQKLLEDRVPPPYVMLGFGPGLTIEAALIR